MRVVERRKRLQRTYGARDRCLQQLGFRSYRDYLQSPLWREIRAAAFASFGRDCSFCSAPASAVHHARYDIETLAGRRLRHLWPICHRCHELSEFSPGHGMKKTPGGATRTMLRRMNSEGHAAERAALEQRRRDFTAREVAAESLQGRVPSSPAAKPHQRLRAPEKREKSPGMRPPEDTRDVRATSGLMPQS